MTKKVRYLSRDSTQRKIRARVQQSLDRQVNNLVDTKEYLETSVKQIGNMIQTDAPKLKEKLTDSIADKLHGKYKNARLYNRTFGPQPPGHEFGLPQTLLRRVKRVGAAAILAGVGMFAMSGRNDAQAWSLPKFQIITPMSALEAQGLVEKELERTQMAGPTSSPVDQAFKSYGNCVTVLPYQAPIQPRFVADASVVALSGYLAYHVAVGWAPYDHLLDRCALNTQAEVEHGERDKEK